MGSYNKKVKVKLEKIMKVIERSTSFYVSSENEDTKDACAADACGWKGCAIQACGANACLAEACVLDMCAADICAIDTIIL